MDAKPKRSRHVPLIAVAPLSTVVLVQGEPSCPVCAEIETRRGVVGESIAALDRVGPILLETERSLLALQKELREIRADLGRSVRLQKKALVSHPRCSLCGVLIGKGHRSTELVQEPHGLRLVCPQCYGWLDKTETTVDAQRLRERSIHGEGA